MKKNKLLMLCTLLIAGTLALTACGNNGNNGTDAPYEDDTNNKVNDTNNGTNNGTNGGTNNGTMGGDLKDAGRNLMDSIEDTGDAIRDGIDNLGDNNRNNSNRTNP